MDTLVDLQIADDVETNLAPDDVRRWVAHVLQSLDWQGSREVCIRVVSRAEIQDLNNEYRGKNNATNVLSFGYDGVDGLPEEHGTLGDLAICADVVEEEAAQQGKTPMAHWTHLVMHGVLHLIGYDHETDSEAREMEALEVRMLADLGIANPYAESF